MNSCYCMTLCLLQATLFNGGIMTQTIISLSEALGVSPVEFVNLACSIRSITFSQNVAGQATVATPPGTTFCKKADGTLGLIYR
jgi:hypothetical protein